MGQPARNKKKHLGPSEDEELCLHPNLVLTQDAQADLTHHLFDVHLPPLARVVDPSEPAHHLQGHLAPELVLVLEGLGQLQDGGRVVRLGERDEVHQEELEDLVEVRRGERAQRTLWARAFGMGCERALLVSVSGMRREEAAGG